MSVRALGILEATSKDVAEIEALLEKNDLLTHDILAPNTQYWLVRDEQNQIIGTGGVEYGKKAVLLRSVAVVPDAHSRGVGNRIVSHALAVAIAKGYAEMYLFSVRSGGYWRKLGFEQVPMAEMVEKLGDVPQVKRFAEIGKLEHEVAWCKNLTVGV